MSNDVNVNRFFRSVSCITRRSQIELTLTMILNVPRKWNNGK